MGPNICLLWNGPCTSFRTWRHLGKRIYHDYIMFLKKNHPYRVQDNNGFGGNEYLLVSPLKLNPRRWMHAYRNTL